MVFQAVFIEGDVCVLRIKWYIVHAKTTCRAESDCLGKFLNLKYETMTVLRWNGETISFLCRTATQGPLVVTNKTYPYSEMCTIQVNTSTGAKAGIQAQSFRMNSLWKKQGALTMGQKAKILPSSISQGWQLDKARSLN